MSAAGERQVTISETTSDTDASAAEHDAALDEVDTGEDESGAVKKKKPMRDWKSRANVYDKVRFKLRNGWRNDEAVLNQYFESCVENWKVYKGDRKPHMVLKLQCFYRQATQGDNPDPPPLNMKSTQALKWSAWTALKGMDKTMAKRRFITYLAEINPLLIDVMPDERPPHGFPTDKFGNVYCAKCNTKVGCSRPLLDDKKIDLKEQLFENEELHEPQALRKWVKHAIETQRCVWGIHRMVPKIDVKQFHAWFDRAENGGYCGYESTAVMDIVRELLHFHYELAYDMQQNKKEYAAEVFNHQVEKVLRLKSLYEELSGGEEFIFEAPCRAYTNPLCNQRRRADGGKNHMHPVELDPPSAKDLDTYDKSIELRKQCKTLGLPQTTGAVHNVQERCDIYRLRLAKHFECLQVALKAKEKNDQRIFIHEKEKSKVIALSKEMIIRQTWDACHANKMDHIMTLVRRGCDPNTETPRGLTPLLCAVLCGAPTEIVEELMHRKVNINAVNCNGMTPLIMACRLKDTKMIHVLMRSGAAALQDGGRRGGGRTAIHWCAVHGCEEEVKIILDYVKEGGGDSLRLVRLLDAQSDDGDSALMLAARSRNGLMCRVLTSLGANPNIRNKQSRNACYIARNAGWAELADWLEKKVGAGVAKLETFSDLQYDKTVRYGQIRTKESIEEFCRTLLEVISGRNTTSPMGPPSNAANLRADMGDRGVKEQQSFVDMHRAYILGKTIRGEDLVLEDDDPKKASITAMQEILASMLDSMRKGMVSPNVEAAAKPLPWTPLMCAAALNEVRTIKLMIRDGADPNYPNGQGTTAVMVASQLHCIEALVEMLIMGGSASQADNFGFTALAYADSLPLPTCMKMDSVGFIMDSDTSGTKKIDASRILKLAIKSGASDLKRIVEENNVESSRDAVVAHYRFMRLLEVNGMSRIETTRHVQEQVLTVDWRIEAEEEKKRKVEEFSETSSEMRDRISLEKLNKRRAEEKAEIESQGLRCPICTLSLPCPHFFKADVLKKFIDKQNKESVSTGSSVVDAINAAMKRSKLKKEKLGNKGNEVLEEAGLADRKSDRSLALANKYRAREIELDRIAEAKAEQLRLADERAEAKIIAIANGTWVLWKQYQTLTGIPYWINSDTLERWEEHENEDTGYNYYYNPKSKESRWENPALPKAVIVDESAAASKMITDGVAEGKEASGTSTSPNKKAGTYAKENYEDKSGGGDEEGEQLDSPVRRKSLATPGIKSLLKVTVPLGDGAGGEGGESIALPAKKKKGRRVFFVDIPGDDLQPFEYPNYAPEGGEGEGEEEEKKAQEEVVVELTEEEKEEKRWKEQEEARILREEQEAKLAALLEMKRQFEEEDIILAKKKLWDLVDDDEDKVEPIIDPLSAKFARLHNNPLPSASSRRLFMFTADPLSRNGQMDGLLQSPGKTRKMENLGGKVLARKSMSKDPVVQKTKLPPSRKIGESSKEALEAAAQTSVTVSGWLFTSLTAVTSVNPMNRVSLKPEVFASMIEYIRGMFFEEWLPRLVLQPLTDPQTWKITAPRCVVCRIGYVRMGPAAEASVGKGSSGKKKKGSFNSLQAEPSEEDANQYTEETLCLACLIRMKLYERARMTFPRTFRKNAKVWPFTETAGVQGGETTINTSLGSSGGGGGGGVGGGQDDLDSLEGSVTHASFRGGGGLGLNHYDSFTIERSRSLLNPRSPVTSQRLLQWDAMEHMEDMMEQQRIDSIAFSWTQRTVDIDEEGSVGSASLTSTDMLLEGDTPTAAGGGGGVRHVLSRGSTFGSFGMNSTSGLTVGTDSLGGGTGAINNSSSHLSLPSASVANMHHPSLARNGSVSTLGSSSKMGVSFANSIDAAPSSPTSKSNNNKKLMRAASMSSMPSIQSVGTLQSSLQGSSGMMSRTGGGSLAVGGSAAFINSDLAESSLDVSLSQLSIPSVFGSEDGTDPGKIEGGKAPPELLMLPYLICKGHFEEVERTVRITIDRDMVNEGEGIVLLLKALHLQADMYKLMSLWPLALAVYLDAADLVSSLLGYGDPLAIAAHGLVVSCMRKMHSSNLAKQYIASMCNRLEADTLGSRSFAASRAFQDYDRKNKKAYVKTEAVWTKMIAVEHGSFERDHFKSRFSSLGLAGLYRLMTAVDGFSAVGRAAFVAHCDLVDPSYTGRFAKFVMMCFRMRACDHTEVFRHFVQQTLQSHLSKPLVNVSEVSRLYRIVTPPQHIEAVKDFLFHGLAVSVEVFDDMLLHSLRVLAPEYKRFYLRHGGAGMRDNLLETTAEGMHCNVQMIQMAWRLKGARLRLARRRVEKAAEIESARIARIKYEEED